MIAPAGRQFCGAAKLTPGQRAISINQPGRVKILFLDLLLELKEGFFAFSANREPKMDRLRDGIPARRSRGGTCVCATAAIDAPTAPSESQFLHQM